MERDKVILEQILKEIVNNPDSVIVDRTVDDMGVLLTVSVAREDLGIVIGKKGQNAMTIRSLMKIVGAKNKARVNVKVNTD